MDTLSNEGAQRPRANSPEAVPTSSDPTPDPITPFQWYAGLAMLGLINVEEGGSSVGMEDEVARQDKRMADAMIREEEK